MPDINQNKKKAILEQWDAEEKILSNDYTGARDNLLMAQKLFPAIDNIGAILAVCDILSASNIKFTGYGIDYYWGSSASFVYISCC